MFLVCGICVVVIVGLVVCWMWLGICFILGVVWIVIVVWLWCWWFWLGCRWWLLFCRLFIVWFWLDDCNDCDMFGLGCVWWWCWVWLLVFGVGLLLGLIVGWWIEVCSWIVSCLWDWLFSCLDLYSWLLLDSWDWKMFWVWFRSVYCVVLWWCEIFLVGLFLIVSVRFW